MVVCPGYEGTRVGKSSYNADAGLFAIGLCRSRQGVPMGGLRTKRDQPNGLNMRKNGTNWLVPMEVVDFEFRIAFRIPHDQERLARVLGFQ